MVVGAQARLICIEEAFDLRKYKTMKPILLALALPILLTGCASTSPYGNGNGVGYDDSYDYGPAYADYYDDGGDDYIDGGLYAYGDGDYYHHDRDGHRHHDDGHHHESVASNGGYPDRYHAPDVGGFHPDAVGGYHGASVSAGMGHPDGGFHNGGGFAGSGGFHDGGGFGGDGGFHGGGGFGGGGFHGGGGGGHGGGGHR